MFELNNEYALTRLVDFKIDYVSLISRYGNKWVICHLKGTDNWDCPGGKIEENEIPINAAERELFEETGATEVGFYPLFIYEILSSKGLSYGIQYYCMIRELGPLPDSEIDRIELVDDLPLERMKTPQVHSKLLASVKRILQGGLLAN